MSIVHELDALPLWAVFLLSVISILIAIEVGYRSGLRYDRKGLSERQRPSTTGTVVGASLGLLAFMLAFTFGSVTSRYDTRKELVLQEANSIGTGYLRADLLAEPHRSAVQELFRQYVNARLEVANTLRGRADINALITFSAQVHEQLWAHCVAAAAEAPTPITALFVNGVNSVIDINQERITVARDHRMPDVFWATLYLLAIITMVLGGYGSGVVGERRNATSVAMATAFSIVLSLIVGLDRPLASASLVNQQPFRDLQSSIGKPDLPGFKLPSQQPDRGEWESIN